jgi:hypothetical protein
MTETSTAVALKNQVFSNLGEEVVILHLEKGFYYGLNEAGGRVWNFIQSPRYVREIKDMLIGNYDADPLRCEKDLEVLLAELEKEALIEVKDGTGV